MKAFKEKCVGLIVSLLLGGNIFLLPFECLAGPISTNAFDLALGLAEAAEAPTGGFEISPVGVPLGTGILKMEITIVVNGKKVTKTVEIPKGDIKTWVRPDRDPKATDKDRAQQLADSKGQASQDKAKVIADAINAAFKDEFATLGEKAGTGRTKVTE